eukprot:5719904-Pleurochrysis_carterae.AAC.2
MLAFASSRRTKRLQSPSHRFSSAERRRSAQLFHVARALIRLAHSRLAPMACRHPPPSMCAQPR